MTNPSGLGKTHQWPVQLHKAGLWQYAHKTTLIDIVKLLEQQIDEFYPNFEEHNLVCEFKAYTPSAMVLADGWMIARAFENLITNAIKYGKDGKDY